MERESTFKIEAELPKGCYVLTWDVESLLSRFTDFVGLKPIGKEEYQLAKRQIFESLSRIFPGAVYLIEAQEINRRLVHHGPKLSFFNAGCLSRF